MNCLEPEAIPQALVVMRMNSRPGGARFFLAGVLHEGKMPGKGDRGTSAVLLIDPLATLGAVVFAIAYSKYNPWVFAPIVMVTLLLSLVIAVLLHSSNQTRPMMS